MITLREQAFAKLNLTLDVHEKRADGYHDITTVMQPISMHDTIEIDIGTRAPWKITCTQEGIPTDERNLVWKAASVFFDALGFEPNGIEIRIQKMIPSEAGLGGGSADAAAVLRALNRWQNDIFTMKYLAELGEKVGSDVPFCVFSKTALAEGRGERLTELTDASKLSFVVCKPQASFSTPKLYAKLDEICIQTRPDTKAMCEALAQGDAQRIGQLLCNVFEEATDNAEVEAIKKELLANGALGALMTGSGSATYGVFTSHNAAQKAYDAIKDRPWLTYLAINV